MDTNGFYGDTFSGGWGDFYPARKRSVSAKHPHKIGGNKIALRRSSKVSLGKLFQVLKTIGKTEQIFPTPLYFRETTDQQSMICSGMKMGTFCTPLMMIFSKMGPEI